MLWPTPLFPDSRCPPLHAHHISLCSFNKARLPQATRGAYQLLPHLPYCYQPGLVHTHTYTHSAPLCQTHTHTHSFYLGLRLSHTHTQTGEWMLWGLISVLRGLAATSQTQIPVPRPQRQTYVTRVLMNKGSILLETPLYRSDRLRGRLTMNIHMAQWQSAKKEKMWEIQI